MNLEFKQQGYEDIKYWADKSPDKARHILSMIRELMDAPDKVLPPPEPLKNELAGWFSCPIDTKHRLVFRKDSERIEIAQVRCHN